MYGAYYPYLYGRGARSFHHAPHFQYDRFNVQSGGEYGAGVGGAGVGAAALSSGSGSSGAQSPGCASPAHHPAHHHPAHPPRLRAKEEDLTSAARASPHGSSSSEGSCGGVGGGGGAGAACSGGRRAQYVSANCVVFTHYSGDVAAVVDEHFARALQPDKHKESVPMLSRNLPPSFFNAAVCGVGGGAGAGGAGGVELYEYDVWSGHYGGYHAGHARHDYHAHYPHGLLLPRHLPQYKPVDWGPQHAHLDPACSAYSYSAVPGLEAPVQDTSKDLYWF